MTELTLFDLPNTPDEFGVVLPPSNLRRLDFSGLDYDTARRAMIEYIQSYFPNQFNDFVASNGIMMLMEIVASTVAKLSLRSDMLANEGTLPTATTEEAVVNHLALINQRIKRQTPAVVDVEITVDQPVFTDIEIDAATAFDVVGPDKSTVSYEIYRAPNDWINKIIIPAGKRGVIAYGLEGRFAGPVVVTSPGGPNQRFIISNNNILESPILAKVTFGSSTEEWRVVNEPIERYGPTAKVIEVNFVDNQAVLRFGDDVTGKAPLSGSSVEFRYRAGGGIRGRIGVGQIDTVRQIAPLPPANAAVSVRFRNISPSAGGTNRETLDQAKKRAPRDYALQRSIVTSGDYAQAASTFSHPVFGAVSKAFATVRTSLNANRVELYVLSEGLDGVPTLPNAGLKIGLMTYFNDLNVLTDSVVVLDGAIKPVDVRADIIINKNADAAVIKERVGQAIDDYFNIIRWEMGQAFYLSNLIEVIQAIDGVSYVNIIQPLDNIMPTGELAAVGSAGIGFNEVITIGKMTIGYYYEKSPPPGGMRSGN